MNYNKVIIAVLIIIIILLLVNGPYMEQYKNSIKMNIKQGSDENSDITKIGKIVVYNKFWNINDVKKNPDTLFVYGDNDVSSGKGGQAIIRYEKNTIGIPTKKFPNNNTSSFYTDKEIDENRKKIKNAIENIKQKILNNEYAQLALPANGFGTGLAKLNVKAPLTFSYLQSLLKSLVDELEPDSSSKIKFLNSP